MRRAAVLVLLALSSERASAQTVMDGSDVRLSPALRAEVTAAVARRFDDPQSAQFRHSTHPRYDHVIVCGEVNGKAKRDGYVGFRPFLYDRSRKQLLIFEPDASNPYLKELQLLPFRDSGCAGALGIIKKEQSASVHTTSP